MHMHGLSEDGKTITLHKFEGPVPLDPMGPEDATANLLVVDTETTGLDPNDHTIIEFAAVLVRCCPDGRVVEHLDSYEALQDPGAPLDPVITQVTGLTNQDLEGHEIDDARVAGLFAKADLVVSHHAAFDWQFCRRRWPNAVDGKVWGCSLRQIDWAGLGFPGAKQEVLARYHGFFYDAHRALVDVQALLNLLRLSAEPGQPRYLAQLIRYTETPRYRVVANGTPFAAKDALKQRGYRWDPERRAWWTIVLEDDKAAEDTWLEQLYQDHYCRGRPSVTQVDPANQWA